MVRALAAALLLLHACACLVSGMHPTVNPRGWKAAKEAERRAGRRRSPPLPPPAGQDGIGGPADAAALPLAELTGQQACGAASQADLWAPQLPFASRPALAAAAAATFALGVLCGMLLLLGLQRWRRRRAPAAAMAGLQSEAASCAAGEAAAKTEPAKEGKQGGESPAAASHAEAGQPERSSEAEAAAASEAASSTLAAAAAAAKAAGEKQAEGSGESLGTEEAAGPAGAIPPEAAIAAAVQELVMQSSASGAGSRAEAEAEEGSAVGEHAGGGQEGKQAAPALAVEEVPPPAGPVAALAGGGMAGGALGALRSEDQADVAAAAQLVLTMCRSMHVDPAQLSRGERLQLIYTMLQAWQAQQARRHAEQMHKLGSEANELRGQQRDIAAHQAARQAAKDAYRLSLERTEGFRRMCSDTLTFGLVVMLAAAAYQLRSRGLLTGITASCGTLGGTSGGFFGSRWGFWAAWRGAETAACYVFSIGDALLGVGVLLAAPWLVYRSGLMSDYHTMPISKLFIGLGLVCGLCGFLAVGKLGGHRATWLAAWEAWVALHIAFSAAAYRVQRVGLWAQQAAAAAAGPAAAAEAAGRMYESGGGWLPIAMWVGLGLMLPVVAGVLPFR